MEFLVLQLEHTTLISIGHRPELDLFQTRKIALQRRRGRTRPVIDIYRETNCGPRGPIRGSLQRNTNDTKSPGHIQPGITVASAEIEIGFEGDVKPT